MNIYIPPHLSREFKIKKRREEARKRASLPLVLPKDNPSEQCVLNIRTGETGTMADADTFDNPRRAFSIVDVEGDTIAPQLALIRNYHDERRYTHEKTEDQTILQFIDANQGQQPPEEPCPTTLPLIQRFFKSIGRFTSKCRMVCSSVLQRMWGTKSAS